MTASSVIYGFASGAPTAIWFVLRQLGSSTKLVHVISLYGYSLFVFIPATVRSASSPNGIIDIISTLKRLTDSRQRYYS